MSEHDNIKDKTPNTKFVNNISQLQTNENLNNKDNEILATPCPSPTNLRTSPKRLQDCQARQYSLGENACSLPFPQDADNFEPHAKTIETPNYGKNDSKHYRQPNVTSHAPQHPMFIRTEHNSDWRKNKEHEFERPSDNLSSNSQWVLQDHPEEMRNKKTLNSSNLFDFNNHDSLEPKIQQRQFDFPELLGNFLTKGSAHQSLNLGERAEPQSSYARQYSPSNAPEVEGSSRDHTLSVVGAVHQHSRNQLLECENKIKNYFDGHTADVKEYCVDRRLEVSENVRKYSVDHTPDRGDGSEIFHGAQIPEVEDNLQRYTVLKQDEGDYGEGWSECQSRKVEEIREEISAITNPHAEDIQHENRSAEETENLCFERQPAEIGHSERTNSESQQTETGETGQMHFEVLSLDTREKYEKSSKSRSLKELNYEEMKCQPLEREDNSKISSQSQSLTQGTALKSNDFIQSANRSSLSALHSKQHHNSDHQNKRAKLQLDKELVPREINRAELFPFPASVQGADPELENQEEEVNTHNEQLLPNAEADVYLRLHDGHAIEEAEGAVDGFQNDDPHSQGAVNQVAFVLPPLVSRPVSEETKSCLDRLLPTQERQFPDADAELSSVNTPSFSTELHLPFREDGDARLAPGSMVHTGHRHNCETRGLSPFPRSPEERCVARGVGSLAPVPTGYIPSEMTATRRRGRVRLRDSSTGLLTGMHRRDDNESERLLLLRGHHRPAALHHQQRRPTSDPALGVHCLVAVGVTVTPDERDFQIPGVVNLLSSAARASRIPEIRGNRGHFSFIHLRPGVSVQSEETGEDHLIPAQIAEFAHRAPPGVDIYHQDTHDIDLHLRRVLGAHLHLRPGSTIQSGVTEVSFTDIDVSLSSALDRRLAYRTFAGK